MFDISTGQQLTTTATTTRNGILHTGTGSKCRDSKASD